MYYFVSSVCENPGFLRALYFAIIIRDILFTLIPVGIIAMTMFDFSKAVVADGEGGQVKAAKLIPKRMMYAVIVFSVPWVVTITMKILDGLKFNVAMDYNTCIHNAENGDFAVFDERQEEAERREREESGQQGEAAIDESESPSRPETGSGSSSRGDEGPLITGKKADNLVDEMLRVANQQLGRDNSDGKYGTPGLAWCAMFATWVMKNTEVDGVNLYNDIVQKEYRNTNDAGAGCTMYLFEKSSSLRFYYSKYYAENVKTDRKEDAKYVPKKGDLVYFYWRHNHDGNTWKADITSTCPSGTYQISHIGIVDHVEGNTVYTIEGNTGGSKVANMSYDINGTGKWSGADIVGYGSWYSEGGSSDDGGSSGDGSGSGSSTRESAADIQKKIEKYIKEKDYNISLLYYDLTSGYEYKYNGNVDYYGASTIKTLDVLYYYANGKPELKKATDLETAITVSDNEAHKRNIDVFGLDNYRRFGEKLGVSRTIMNTVTKEDNKFGQTNVTTQLIYLKNLYKLIKDMDNNTAPKSYFINSTYNCLEYSGSPVTMHKYGWGRDGKSFHDVGIVLDEKPYIVIILTEGASKGANCGNGGTAITDLSKYVYELHKMIRRTGSGGIRDEVQ